MGDNRIIECLSRIELPDGRKRMLMGSDFRHLGKNVVIYPQAKLIKPEVISIGDDCLIDDFTFIYGGKGCKIGHNVHIASHSVIGGGGSITIGNYVGISWGVRFATGGNDHRIKGHMTAAAPLDIQAFFRGYIDIEDDVIIFANSVIGANVKIGEGAVIGALTLVNKDIEPWSINVGTPCRKVGMRDKSLVEVVRDAL